MRNALLLCILAAAAAPALRAQGPAPARITLARAVAIAADTAPAVRLAELEVRRAGARAAQARADLLPSLSATAGVLNRSYNWAGLGVGKAGLPLPDLVGPFGMGDARLQLSQTLFDAAGLQRVRASGHDRAYRRAEAAAAREEAAHRAAVAYLDAARAAERLEARRCDAALAAELAELGAARTRAGLATELDVTRARVRAGAADRQVLQAAHEAARAALDLALALGLDPGTPLAASLAPGDSVTTAAPLPAEPEAAVAFALERRGDLRAEAARRLHARAEHGSVRLERLPRLEVVADYGFNGPAMDDMLRTQTLNLQLSLPLLDGFRHEGRRAERAVALREAELRERETARRIEAEVRRALLDLASAREQEAAAAAQLRLAHEEVAQARRAYEMGVGSSLEVVSAQVSLGQAEDAAIDARFTRARAEVERARALGVAATLR